MLSALTLTATCVLDLEKGKRDEDCLDRELIKSDELGHTHVGPQSLQFRRGGAISVKRPKNGVSKDGC